MKLSPSTIKALSLRTGYMDEPLETPEEYCARIRAVLPNLPDEVITQWFYEHAGTLEMHMWLHYSSIQVSLKQVSLSQLMHRCLSEHPTVTQYQAHYHENNTSQRMAKLGEYMQENGTWPIPPIILANSENNIRTSWGLQCDAPFHLLEGHHRFAVFYAFAAKGAVNETHKVWLITQASYSSSKMAKA